MSNIYADGYGHERVIEAGVIDDAAIELFTRGQCHALALAFAELLGWDIGVLTYHGPGYRPGAHLLAAAPDGTFIDIRGRCTRTDLEAHWCTEPGDRIEVTVYDLYMAGAYIDSGPTQYDQPQMELACSMAQTLIRQLQLEPSDVPTPKLG